MYNVKMPVMRHHCHAFISRMPCRLRHVIAKVITRVISQVTPPRHAATIINKYAAATPSPPPPIDSTQTVITPRVPARARLAARVLHVRAYRKRC